MHLPENIGSADQRLTTTPIAASVFLIVFFTIVHVVRISLTPSAFGDSATSAAGLYLSLVILSILMIIWTVIYALPSLWKRALDLNSLLYIAPTLISILLLLYTWFAYRSFLLIAEQGAAANP
jgi:hypothetical protein